MIVALLMFIGSEMPGTDHHDSIRLDDPFRIAGRVLSAVLTSAGGQIRGRVVREGMAEETVSRILGSKCVVFLAPASFATTNNQPLITYYYIKTDVHVHYRYDDKSDVFRVDQVTLPPLTLPSFVLPHD